MINLISKMHLLPSIYIYNYMDEIEVLGSRRIMALAISEDRKVLG